jgi:dolichol kinase
VNLLSAFDPTSAERLKLLASTLIIAAFLSELLMRPVDFHGVDQIQFNLSSAYLTGLAKPSFCASVAFSFVYPLLGQVLFPLAYVFGLLVGWSQAAKGIHSWMDIGESLAIAGFGYAVAEALVLRQKNAVNRGDERARKIAHILSNLSICLFIWLLGTQTIFYFVLVGTLVGILLMHLTIIEVRIPGIEQWLKTVGRKGEIPGEGAMYNALGILFALGLLRSDYLAAIATIMILALGDGFATYIGTIYGRRKLPWNNRKTIEGSIGFFVGAMCALLILPLPLTVAVVLLASVIETLPIRLNDNITLPIVSSLVYYFLL